MQPIPRPPPQVIPDARLEPRNPPPRVQRVLPPAVPGPLPDLLARPRRLEPELLPLVPWANRVQAPDPEPVNRQGGRIGRPGTGSRATRERRMRREGAMRMGDGAGRDPGEE